MRKKTNARKAGGARAAGEKIPVSARLPAAWAEAVETSVSREHERAAAAGGRANLHSITIALWYGRLVAEGLLPAVT